MSIVPVSAPAPVHVYGGFDYVAVDARRRRVYAAHTGSGRLLVVDADSGREVGQVDVGPVHGVAVDPVSGDVFTGDGTDMKISRVDPIGLKVLGEADVPGPIDAIAYDPTTRRIYADEDSGTDVYVVDAKSMKSVGNVRLPGHDEEYLAVDPRTHVVYQNVPDKREFVEIDPGTLHVTKVVPTPLLTSDHPLQYDAEFRQIVVGGKNGVLAVYSPGGALLSHVTFPRDVDQCSLDAGTHVLACAGNGVLSAFRLRKGGAPVPLGTVDTQHDAHTVAIDAKTGYLWTVWSQRDRDAVQRFRVTP